jgi:uncharacterized protein YlxW (UPF0749 family)
MNGWRPLAVAVIGAALLGTGCGKQEPAKPGPVKKLSAKEKREKAAELKRELERLKNEIAELQRSADAVEKELEQAVGPENK